MTLLEVPAPSLADRDTQSDIRSQEYGLSGGMHETGAQGGALGRHRGMGWGGRREGGPGWGTHVNPWLIHVNVWQKPLQYCEVTSLQLIKINEKKKKKVWAVGTIYLSQSHFLPRGVSVSSFYGINYHLIKG